MVYILDRAIIWMRSTPIKHGASFVEYYYFTFSEIRIIEKVLLWVKNLYCVLCRYYTVLFVGGGGAQLLNKVRIEKEQKLFKRDPIFKKK